MPVAPQYVSTPWNIGNLVPYVDGPTITSTGTYISDQTMLDKVVAGAAAAGVTLIFSSTGPTPPVPPREEYPFIRYDVRQVELTDADRAQARDNLGAVSTIQIDPDDGSLELIDGG